MITLQPVLHLFIGRRPTGVSVRPDRLWPGMWRVHGADGRVSDMVNLARAKDAAIGWAMPRGIGDKTAHWKPDGNADGEPAHASNAPAGPEIAPAAETHGRG